MWPRFSTQPMAEFLKVNLFRVQSILAGFSPTSESSIEQRGSLGGAPSRVLDFNHQGTNVTELRVMYSTRFVTGTSHLFGPKKP